MAQATGVKGSTQAGPEVTFTPFEIYTLWKIENPNSKANPAVMTAIALAESGGRVGIVNSVGACGLWQIHPYQNGCTNAKTNAKMANAKFEESRKTRGNGYLPWETYTNHAYEKEIPKVKKALESARGEVVGAGIFGIGVGPDIAPEASTKFGEAIEGAISWTGELGKILSFLGSGAGWTRVAKVAGGGIIIIIALSELAKAGSGSSSPNIATKTVSTGKTLAVDATAGAVAGKIAQRTQAAKEAAKRTAESSE